MVLVGALLLHIEHLLEALVMLVVAWLALSPDMIPALHPRTQAAVSETPLWFCLQAPAPGCALGCMYSTEVHLPVM